MEKCGRAVKLSQSQLFRAEGWHISLEVSIFYYKYKNMCTHTRTPTAHTYCIYIYVHTFTHCHTCLGNDSRVFAAAWVLAQATQVFTVDAKHIFIAHDQIWSCAVCPSVMLINGEPFLKREKKWYYFSESLKHKTRPEDIEVIWGHLSRTVEQQAL